MADQDVNAGKQADDQATRSFFSRRLEEHGLSPLSLGWSGEQSQALRFKVLSEIGIGKDDAVLDVGCGTGDLLAYLRASGHQGSYTGIDIVPDMVEAASARFAQPEPDAIFRVHDLYSTGPTEDLRSDYVFSSGIFYLRRHEPAAYMAKMMELMFSLANKGLALNSLSAWADQPPQDNEFRAEPAAMLEEARKLTSKIALRHDYHSGDFTLYLHQEATAG